MWIKHSASLAIVAVSAVAAAFFVAPPVAASLPARHGAPCAQPGAQVENKRWVFTCTKKSGKTVWVRKPKPSPVPTWQEVAQRIAANASERRIARPTHTFALRASPTVKRSTARAVLESVNSAYEVWNAIAPLPRGYPVLVINHRSGAWYQKATERFPDDLCGPDWWVRVNATPDRTTGAVCSSPQHDWGYMVIYLGKSAKNIATLLAVHEVVHVAQAQLLGNRAMNSMECWLGEGMAELYTGALSMKPPKSGAAWAGTQSYRRIVVSNLRVLGTPGSSLRDPNYWLDIIRSSENRGTHLCWGFGVGYSLGYLVSEKLVADFGEESLFEWMRLTSESLDSDAAFAQVFGIGQDDWYAQSAATYVAREVALILG